MLYSRGGGKDLPRNPQVAVPERNGPPEEAREGGAATRDAHIAFHEQSSLLCISNQSEGKASAGAQLAQNTGQVNMYTSITLDMVHRCGIVRVRVRARGQLQNLGVPRRARAAAVDAGYGRHSGGGIFDSAEGTSLQRCPHGRPSFRKPSADARIPR